MEKLSTSDYTLKQKVNLTVSVWLTFVCSWTWDALREIQPKGYEFTFDQISQAFLDQLFAAILLFPVLVLITHLAFKEQENPPKEKVRLLNVFNGTFVGLILVVLCTLAYIGIHIALESIG